MQRAAIIGTKAAIVLLFLVTVFVQFVWVPVLAFDTARVWPEYSWLTWPGIVGVGLAVLCIQLVLVCIWKLLPMTQTNQIFDGSAFPWVDRMIKAGIVFCVLTLAGGVLLVFAGALHPSLLMLGILMLSFGGGMTLLLVLMRGLLVRASDLSQEMAEVI